MWLHRVNTLCHKDILTTHISDFYFSDILQWFKKGKALLTSKLGVLRICSEL